MASLTAINVTSCSGNDGSITTTVSGGTTPYAYLWSNGASTDMITGLSVGTYTLTLTDANGCKKMATAPVIWTGAIPITVSNPLTEGFESTDTLPADWKLDNPDGDVSWQVVTTVAHKGSNSIGFNNCDGNGSGNSMAGTKDRFITAAYDFTNTTAKASLSFDFAYAVLKYKNQVLNDSLAVFSSTDCGLTWDLLYLKGGKDLSDLETSVPCWTPTDADWRTTNIELPMLAGKASVLFAFENRSSWGEWIYIDNINISAATAVEELNPFAAFKIYPNHASTSFNIEGTSAVKKIQYSIYNILGKEIKNGEIENYSGSFNEKIQVSNFSGGMYFIKFSDSKTTWTQKINIE